MGVGEAHGGEAGVPCAEVVIEAVRVKEGVGVARRVGRALALALAAALALAPAGRLGVAEGEEESVKEGSAVAVPPPRSAGVRDEVSDAVSAEVAEGARGVAEPVALAKKGVAVAFALSLGALPVPEGVAETVRVAAGLSVGGKGVEVDSSPVAEAEALAGAVERAVGVDWGALGVPRGDGLAVPVPVELPCGADGVTLDESVGEMGVALGLTLSSAV